MRTEILFPPSITAKTGRASFRQDRIGQSDATVLLYDAYVLKIRPENSWNTNDVQVMQWLAGKLPVPEIAAHEVADGKDWLLMTRIKGKMLCDPSVMEKPTVLLDCMAEALNLLWSVDIGSCPFTRTARIDCLKRRRFFWPESLIRRIVNRRHSVRADSKIPWLC